MKIELLPSSRRFSPTHCHLSHSNASADRAFFGEFRHLCLHFCMQFANAICRIETGFQSILCKRITKFETKEFLCVFYMFQYRCRWQKSSVNKFASQVHVHWHWKLSFSSFHHILYRIHPSGIHYSSVHDAIRFQQFLWQINCNQRQTQRSVKICEEKAKVIQNTVRTE